MLLVIAGAGYAGVTLAGRGQDEDPALTRTPEPGAPQLPGEGSPDGASPRGGGDGPRDEPTGGLTPVTPTPST